jgi:hypothetical protein
MRRRDLILGGTLALAATAAVGAGLERARPTPRVQQIIDAHERLRRRLSPADRALLNELASRLLKALPRNARLPDDARSLLAKAASGLSDSDISTLADDASAQLLEATQQMQETQMSFNLQYLQLQSQMQNENRSYTAVSNIMKTKHDTVKNSISNIR